MAMTPQAAAALAAAQYPNLNSILGGYEQTPANADSATLGTNPTAYTITNNAGGAAVAGQSTLVTPPSGQGGQGDNDNDKKVWGINRNYLIAGAAAAAYWYFYMRKK